MTLNFVFKIRICWLYQYN